MQEARFPPLKASRLLIESVAIVGSILLAFAIDAWWDGRSQDAQVREQRNALAAQMAANRQLLASTADAAQNSLRAAQQLVRLIGPKPTLPPQDSVGVLINASFSSVRMLEPELGAVDALLNTGAFGLSLDRALNDHLVTYRSTAKRFSGQLAQFLDAREKVIEYLATVAPLAFVSHNTGAHEPSDFPAPLNDLLRDPRLEGSFANLAVKTNNVLRTAQSLRDQSDSIMLLLRRPK